MSPIEIIRKYYRESPAYPFIFEHSIMVADMALDVARRHPQLHAEPMFLYEAAILHDIGIMYTQAPSIGCHGNAPYLCHGYLGADLLRLEGLGRHALVAERHTGAGISEDEITSGQLPLPLRVMIPQSIEEQIVCYADKFYSKSSGTQRLSYDHVCTIIARYGEEPLGRFQSWHRLFI